MAQAITNTVKNQSPLGGLLSAPKTGNSFLSGYGTGNSFVSGTLNASKPPQTALANANMSTPNGPAYAPPPTVTAKPVAAPAPVDKQPVQGLQQAASTQQASVYAPGSLQNSGGYENSGAAQPAQIPVPGLFSSVVSSLANRGTQASPQYTDSYNQAQQYNTQLQQSMSNEANALKTNGLNPIPIGDQEGRAAVIRQQYLDQQKALGSGFQGASSLVAGANTQQATQNSALNSAANLAQPQVTSYGQTSFDPTTQQFAGGGSLPPEVMQQYAQMAATGQYSAIPSLITSNPVLSAQLNVAAQAINPNYTPITSQAQGQVLATIPDLQSKASAATGIKNTIQLYLQANPTLNTNDLVAGNKLAQWLQSGQFGDPKYQTLGAYINEYVSTLAPILGVGGDTTDLKTQIAKGMVNGAASGTSISEVLNNIDTLAAHKIQDLQSGALGGGTTVPNGTTGGTGSGGLYDF